MRELNENEIEVISAGLSVENGGILLVGIGVGVVLAPAVAVGIGAFAIGAGVTMLVGSAWFGGGTSGL